MARILFVFVLFFPTELLAIQMETNDLFFSGLKMFIGMIIVVGLMLLVYVLNRKGIKFLKGSKVGRIKIVEMHHVGGRKMLCLVEVSGQELLLGLGNERIDFLYHFNDRHAGKGFENELRECVEAER
jgi:flagellar protein FliO/FliZ